MSEKKTATNRECDRLKGASTDQTPRLVLDCTVSEADPTTQATTLLLSEAAHHSFRLEPLAEAAASWSRVPKARKQR